MWKFLKQLFGYKEVVVIDNKLEVFRAQRKYYRILWKSVFKNFVSLLKSWPRQGKYVKFYVNENPYKKNDFGHISPDLVELAVRDRNTYFSKGTVDKPSTNK